MGMPSMGTLRFRMASLQSFPQSSSGGCEKLASRGSSAMAFKGVGVAQSSPQELRRTVVVRGHEKGSDYFDTTSFFLDELVEAKSTVEMLAELENSTDSFWQEEGTSQRKEYEDSEKSPETISDVWEDSKSGRLGRMPLESNGPPMVILQPYLKADNPQEQAKEKLPHLPRPMPHKVRRAPGLPRPSLRRRLGIAYARKSVPIAQEHDSLADSDN